MNRTPLIDIVSKDPKDYLDCALSLMTLSFHNKNYLDSTIAHNDVQLWVEVIGLLEEAKKLLEKEQES